MSLLLDVDIAHATAEYRGHLVDCGVAVLVTMEERKIVYQHGVAVPLVIEDWLERCVAHLATLRAYMERPEAGDWQVVAASTNWWMREPGDPEYPEGLRC